MNHITLKGYILGDDVGVEFYDAASDQVTVTVVKVADLWRWLWTKRPCVVYRGGREHRLDAQNVKM